MNVSALHLTPFILIYFYGASSAGFFFLAQRAMGAPMAFLGMAIANVYLAELPRLKESEPERLMSFYLRSCRNLIAVGLPVVALATLILWWGVDLIFGAEWSKAAEFVVYLALFSWPVCSGAA
ncbi:oligosaccharide flippase family protein [Pseudomonas lalucatii]|nr:oligosaccharide flippase family protein [Pseudomonas lalucatii]